MKTRDVVKLNTPPNLCKLDPLVLFKFSRNFIGNPFA